MKQISSPQVAITTRRGARVPKDAKGVPFILYAPGDATLYRIALVAFWPAEPESQLPVQTVLTVSVNGEVIVIVKPMNDHSAWTAERFKIVFGDAYLGWWPAVRPLLATLRGTPESERSTTVTRDDWQLVRHLA